MTDEEKLVLKARELDPQAWSHIFDRHYGSVYAYVCRRVGSPPLAEDLTASVFVRALEGIGKYKYRGIPLAAWLMSITRNLVIDHFRRAGRSPQEPLDLELISKEPSPEQVAEQAVLREQLRGALEHLTEEQRQVVVLRFVDGLSSQEVSHLLDKPEGAIRALQHRALASLRRFLQREEEDA